MRPSATGLAWLLIVAAVLRFWSLGYGIRSPSASMNRKSWFAS